MTYEPIPVKQADGSTFQWANCGCATGATDLDRDTAGHHRTTGAHVRALTGDTSGGTRLEQEDAALRIGFPPDDHLDVRTMFPFEDMVVEVADGRGADLCIGYGPVSGTKYDGSPGFKGNHRWFVNAVRIVRTSHGAIDYAASDAKLYDPLWDARRPGIPSQAFRWLPLDLVRRAAGALELSPGRHVGLGLCYVGFTRRATMGPSSPPTPGNIDYGGNAMITTQGLTIASSHVLALSKGQPLYREAKVGASVVTHMSRSAKVDYFGLAGAGWYAVKVVTGNFPDKVKRRVLVYVPRAVGTPVAK